MRAAQRRSRRPRQTYRAAERRGRAAEFLCRWHLRLHGWHIVASGWRCPSGEIDILARRRGVLAVIEVKSRPDLAGAAGAIGPRQRRRIATRRGSVSRGAPRSGRARSAVRRDAGRPPPPAAPSTLRLAHRRLATTGDSRRSRGSVPPAKRARSGACGGERPQSLGVHRGVGVLPFRFRLGRPTK